MSTASNPLTIRSLALRAISFVVLTAGATIVMAVPYLA